MKLFFQSMLVLLMISTLYSCKKDKDPENTFPSGSYKCELIDQTGNATIPFQSTFDQVITAEFNDGKMTWHSMLLATHLYDSTITYTREVEFTADFKVLTEGILEVRYHTYLRNNHTDSIMVGDTGYFMYTQYSEYFSMDEALRNKRMTGAKDDLANSSFHAWYFPVGHPIRIVHDFANDSLHYRHEIYRSAEDLTIATLYEYYFPVDITEDSFVYYLDGTVPIAKFYQLFEGDMYMRYNDELYKYYKQ